MAGMHHALILGSRILAGAVATIAFYFAFFLYENEEGVWQNRIENLWASVYDRAKITDSTSTALFNQIGDVLRRALNRIYGGKMFSMQTISVSTNLSYSGCILVGLLVEIWNVGRGKQANVPNLAIISVIGLYTLLFALLPIFFQKSWAVAASWLPIVTTATAFARRAVNKSLLVGTFYTLVPLALILSLMFDVLSVIVLRNLFTSITKHISTGQIIISVILLFVVTGSIATFPTLLALALHHLVANFAADQISIALFYLNLTTLSFCILPLLMLIVLLVHRLIWPALSHLLYPIASRKVITNRKALV